MGYLTNFIVYMLAMLGIMAFALFVFKKTTGCRIRHSGNGSGLKVTDTLSINARKTLYVIEVGNEKFLIAGDTDRTTLISKLESENLNIEPIVRRQKEVDYADKPGLGIYSMKKTPYDSGIKSLIKGTEK